MAEGIGEEIALEEGESESIFKDLLAEPPAPRREEVVPILAGRTGKGEDEPLEMFEFNPVAVAPTPPKVVVEPGKEKPKPADEKAGDGALEWVVDEK